MSTNTIPANKETALKLYKKADATGKAILVELLGNAFFKPITERVKSFEDACTVLGLDPQDIIGNGSTDEEAYKKLKVIVRALNDGWTPNWDNEDEYKYYPWLDMRGGFSCSGYCCDDTLSTVGSRLCFESSDLAKYAGTQFLSIYKDFFTL